MFTTLCHYLLPARAHASGNQNLRRGGEIASTAVDDAGYRHGVHHAEFEDPRVVAVYDAESPWSREDDFFVSIVDEFAPISPDPDVRTPHILDLGCGTGRLAVGLAGRGYEVTGVDPAAASLDIARARDGSEPITWMGGTSAVLSPHTFDAAVMTSHVAQFFLTDDDWQEALSDLHAALVPEGIITFDARDPAYREWDSWNITESARNVVLPDGRVVHVTSEVTDETGTLVSFAQRYRYPDGSELLSTATLRFRTLAEIEAHLVHTGFVVQVIYGGWDRQPVGAGDGEFLVVARRSSPDVTVAPVTR